ncbi:MAG: peptidylprolyl isomerase [Nitrospirae bacterium]|nr:peptidylprolyl isomerase [Nitrospirota bacterium]
MKGLVSAILLLLFSALCFSLRAEAAADILASVNGENISMPDYRVFVTILDPSLDREKVDEKILRKLIEEKIFVQEAGKKGMTVTDEELEKGIADFLNRINFPYEELQKRITGQGMNMDDYRKLFRENMVMSLYIRSEINASVKVTDEEVSQYYHQNRQSFLKTPALMKVKALFIRLGEKPSLTEVTDLKIRALKIYAEIRAGISIETAVIRYADEAQKKNNGYLGEFGRGELMPALEQRLSGMKEGEISGPVWIREGFYILQLIQRTETSYISAEEAGDRIKAILRKTKQEEKLNEWKRSLWEKASISISPR